MLEENKLEKETRHTAYEIKKIKNRKHGVVSMTSRWLENTNEQGKVILKLIQLSIIQLWRQAEVCMPLFY